MKKIKYEGSFEGDQHYLELEIIEDTNKPDKYILEIVVEEVY